MAYLQVGCPRGAKVARDSVGRLVVMGAIRKKVQAEGQNLHLIYTGGASEFSELSGGMPPVKAVARNLDAFFRDKNKLQPQYLVKIKKVRLSGTARDH
jgi:hypothetical protein